MFCSGRFASCARGASTRLLTIVASTVLSAAIYFVLLQLVVIQAICPWCMLDHTLGFLAAMTGLVIARRLTPRLARATQTKPIAVDPLAEYDAAPQAPLPPRSSALGSVVAGVAVAMAFVGVQHFTGKTPDVARIESGIEAGGPGNELKLTLKNGEVSLPAASLPVIGPATAPRRLILMFDYCCPHCREAHHVIRRLQPTAGDRWQVLFVPSPLNSDCNPGVEETEPRFKDACTLARLSLAVWKLHPDDWAAFDTWLFEPELPRTAEEARQHAAALYGEIELAEVLAKPEIDAVIARECEGVSGVGVEGAAGDSVAGVGRNCGED